MTDVVFREWEAYLCPRCEGSFYDDKPCAALLEQPDLRLSPLRPALLKNLDPLYPSEAIPTKIACPRCQQAMSLEAFSSNLPNKVWRCPEGHGIWLNDGELGRLLTQREASFPLPEPGFIESFRRLAGLRPRLESESLSLETDS